MNFTTTTGRLALPQPRMLLGGSGDADDVDAMVEAKFSKLRVFKSDQCPKSQEWDEFTKTMTYEDEGGNMVCVDFADAEQLSKAHQLIVEEYKRLYTNVLQKTRREVNECEQKAREAEAIANAAAGAAEGESLAAIAKAVEEAQQKHRELAQRVAAVEANLASWEGKMKSAVQALSGGRRSPEELTDEFLAKLMPSEEPATGRRQPCRGIEREYHIGSAFGSRSGFCVYEDSARLLRLSVARARPHFLELYGELYKEGGLTDRLEACKKQAESVSGGSSTGGELSTGEIVVGVVVALIVVGGGYRYMKSRE